ncbi:hypothetical protein [Aequorivita xiaoshiensis]|uniref:TonB-dependent Receptor Plug Domain n=1 Tax=Aequorivita xiaoshiensis TaxID=2874476 RepID=A0A9X1R268_9FLAO|nr:hypothetical protein [Aequorivita xiaoshiensis]MCG2430447.1 hypothetical protein [Aequorivita xiaoshiensis]
MKKSIFIILLILLGNVTFSQIPNQDLSVESNVFPKEKLALTINSNILLAGELLQYSTLNLNEAGKKSKLSKVVYVSMRNENDSVVFHHKLKLNNGSASGDFFIPATLKSGIYKLISYTNFSKNNKLDAYALKTIYVINTFMKMDKVKNVSDSIRLNFSTKFSRVSTSNESNQQIKIVSDKATYGSREKVSLKLEGISNEINGNFVLSVRKLNPIEISGKPSESVNGNSSNVFHIPEVRGELISGTILNNDGKVPAKNKIVSLTIPGEDFIFKSTSTDANGRFFFSLSKGYSSNKGIIQLSSKDSRKENYTINIDKKHLNLNDSKRSALVLNPELKSWLQERSVQIQIENAYFETKRDSVKPHKITSRFYNNLGTVFNLDDYTRFATLRETFVEVITLAAIRGNGANSRFVIHNAYDPNRIAQFNDIPPLVLLDGIEIINNEELINYNPRQIKSVRVITKPYRYGPMIYSGIIAVETVQGDFTPNTTEKCIKVIDLIPEVKGKKYYKPKYHSGADKLSRIPDYRVQLIWNSQIENLKNGFIDSFFTSDIPGTYQISLEGYGMKGEFYRLTYNFMVIQ